MLACPLCHTSNSDNAAQCRACGAPLGGQSTPVAANDTPNALPPGTTLRGGAFSVERVLGQGGFGITYAGRDLDLEREVAIKEFFPFEAAIRIQQDNRLEPSGGLSRSQYEDARQRFLEEARVVARFNHPSIVNVFAAFEEKNTAYMVMEFLSGKNLLQLIEARRTVVEEDAIYIIEHVGHALEVVHAAGMLHRDLKPENIFLTGDINDIHKSRVVLIDFGSARTFTANSTSRLDVLVTPGYAPLEQYSDEARFNAYTDVYSLGATLYHALVGQAPAASTDRAEGVQVLPPQQLNPAVSREVGNAVMWALQLNASERPQTIHEWLLALRSGAAPAVEPTITSAARTLKTTKQSTPAQPRLPDPRLPRMRGILKELDAPESAPPPSPHAARLEQIASRLALLGRFAMPTENQCPSCDQRQLEYVPPAIGVAQCPLCDGHLSQRNFQLGACPVCRKAALKEYSFAEDDLFCPLCFVAPLKKEERKRLILVDLWRTCPNCLAEWDEYSNGSMELKKPGETARGKEYLKQTKPVAEWKAMSGREDRVLRCPACAAQFDVQQEAAQLADERLTLARFPNDPHGVGRQYGGKTFFRSAWARLAQNLPLGAGNTVCNRCHAEWNFDSQRLTLKLLQCEEKHSPLCGQTLPIALWKFRAKGKTSDRAGHLCRACHTEFDDEGGLMKLVRASGVLAPRAGQKYSLSDWHRLARGIPDSHEEGALRHEQTHLQNLQKQEAANRQDARHRARAVLEDELKKLAAQSYLSGYLAARDASKSASGEPIRWMSNATLLNARVRREGTYWDVEKQGALMITSRRIVFYDRPGHEDRSFPLEKVRAATTPSVSGKPMLEIHFQNTRNPVGFLLNEMKVEVEVEGRSLKLTLTPTDLAAWLMSKK
jgi:serine/threonine protein kinase